jgi:hypothetical protein
MLVIQRVFIGVLVVVSIISISALILSLTRTQTETNTVDTFGASGIDGLAGVDGTKGLDGKDGDPGDDGATGPGGNDGAGGADGNDGADGASGQDGNVGAGGADGNDGADGATGQDGNDGATGPGGIDGAGGADGNDGAPGADGNDGADGATGQDGIDGAGGADGNDGAPGADGNDGADGATGQDGNDGAVGATGPGGPTEISFVGIDPSIENYNLDNAQTDYKGSTEIYLSGGVIANGQAVVLEYGASAIRAIAPANMPSAAQVVGITMNATTEAGQEVRVLKSGFGYASLLKPSIIERRLNSASNDTIFTDPLVAFRDSGGYSFDYLNDESLKCVFDAGDDCTWSLQFITNKDDASTHFNFGHSIRMPDRLGIQESTDNFNWSNIVVSWMQKSDVANPPWSQFFPSGQNTDSYNSPAARNGNILPGSLSRANDNGYVTGTPVEVNSRFLRFWFVSDGNRPESGWNIELSKVIPADLPVFIDTVDLTNVTVNSGGALVGRSASEEKNSGSILLRV